MKKPNKSTQATSNSGRKTRAKSQIDKNKGANKKITVKPKSRDEERRELLGRQLTKWRIRAGITATEAGNRAFNSNRADPIAPDSAKRKWQRYEETVPDIKAEELKKVCAAVGGHPRLAAAILGKPFISWKESEHIRGSRSPDKKSNDYYDEDGFEDEIQKYITEEKPEIDLDEKGDFDEFWKVKKKPPKKKSAEQKEAERIAVTNEFLVNRRRKGEFSEGPTDISDYTPSGTSLEYMINMQRFETDDDLEYERSSHIETFFGDFIVFNEDLKFNALQDLWLSFLGRKEENAELLQKIIEFYGQNSLAQPDKSQKLIYKYAAHYATNLLFHLYKLAYDPLNPKSSVDELSGGKLESYTAVRELAGKIKLIPEAVVGREGQRKFLIELFKSSYAALPAESRLELKKDFSRIVFALAPRDKDFSRTVFVPPPEDKAKDILKARERRAVLRDEFKVLAMTCFAKLYYLEKEVYYQLNEEEKSAIKINQNQFFEAEFKENHPLFRFYYLVKPQKFLTNLWLLQDTFDLYNLKVAERDGKKLSIN